MNYTSVSEIFNSSNLTPILENQYSQYGTETIECDGLFEWNDTPINKFNVYHKSLIRNEQLTLSLEVGYNSSNNTTNIKSLYAEEGTLNNFYKFLRIRFVGSTSVSYTNNIDYKLNYDVIFWSTGDISLHMIVCPRMGNKGKYTLQANSTLYTYSVSDNSRDVTFKRVNGDSFEVENSIITLDHPGEWRYLIKSDSAYYTVLDNALSEIDTRDGLSSSVFLTYGTRDIPTTELLLTLNNPEILYWSEKETTIPKKGLIVKGEPHVPHVVYYPSIEIPEGMIVAKLDVGSAQMSLRVLFSISFDDGATWQYYNGKTWVFADSVTDGMVYYVLPSIPTEKWAEVSTSRTCKVRAVLPDVLCEVNNKIYFKLADAPQQE